MWRTKSYYEGLIAKSLYEPLTEAERQRLDRAMKNDASLQKAFEKLSDMAARIPADESLNAPDLLPDLRVAIASESPDPAWRWSAYLPRKRAAVWAVAFGVPLLIGITQLVPMMDPLNEPRIEIASGESLMQQAIAQAEMHFAERDSSMAIQFLEVALRAQPNDPDAGRAQMLLGEIAFEDDRFQTALDAYVALQRDHTGYLEARDLDQRAQVAERIALLDESGRDNFETLHAYNAALAAGDDRFTRLEAVAARAAADPHGLLAARVVRSMAQTLAGTDGFASADARIAALENVRDTTANPIVAARASFEAGRAYEEEVGDTVRAAEAYRFAGRHSAYADAASVAVARLEPQ